MMDNILWWPMIAGFGALTAIVGIIVLIFWIFMIVDCARRTFKNKAEKIIWIVVIVLAGWLGALIYYIAVRVYNPKGLMKK